MDNTSAGHNAEIVWLLLHALEILQIDALPFDEMITKSLDHAVANGIDREYGGVYVEGPHTGGVTDKEKEFWQQVEVMIGMLDGCIRYRSEKYWKAYENVHSFLFRKGINHDLGELWPLLSREGEPIWTHMGHAWKTSYHSVRGMIQCIKRLDRLLGGRRELL
jgi:mannobiose 2-epimerase